MVDCVHRSALFLEFVLHRPRIETIHGGNQQTATISKKLPIVRRTTNEYGSVVFDTKIAMINSIAALAVHPQQIQGLNF